MPKNTHLKFPNILYFSIVLMLLFFTRESFSAQVNAKLSPENFTTQQAARLIITITGSKSGDITIPEIEGLIFHQRGTNKQFQMINGHTSSSVIYTYLVQGMTPGNYTIGPISVVTDGETLETESISCTVANSSKAPTIHQQSSQTADIKTGKTIEDIAFIELIPDKTSGFVGEIIPTKIQAFFYQGARVNLTSLPILKSDGILIDSLSNEPRQQQKTINNTPYTVVTWETALTGIKDGKQKLTMELNAAIQVPSKQPRQMPGFEDRFFQDNFFNDFFTQYKNQPIKVVSPTVSIQINDLPAQGKPKNFSGAIGTFTLDLQAAPTKINQGDPITLKMAIEGAGNFDNVKAPVLVNQDGLKSYTPSSAFTEGTRPHTGKKSFEQAIVVTDSAIKQIPSVTFSFFDPTKKQYQTLFSNPVPITSKTPQPPAQQLSVKKVSTDLPTTIDEPKKEQRFSSLAPVKLSSGSTVSKITPLFLHPVFLAAAALIFMAICTITGYRFRKRHLARNPEIIRTRKIETEKKNLHHQLAQLQSLNDREYLEAAQAGISNLLALLWKAEADSLTTSDIIGKLGPDHPITTLFVYADRASYGALTFAKEEKEQLHKTILNSIDTLS